MDRRDYRTLPTPVEQAVYLSELPTGDLVTPYEAQQLRDAAVRELGLEGLRVAHLVASLRNAALMPDGHTERAAWARAVANLTEPNTI